jgi:sorbitol-6-phosphate 2-dehydrogenase
MIRFHAKLFVRTSCPGYIKIDQNLQRSNMSWLNLEGKTVVVTGGASGIGKHVVQGFLDQGANVVVCDMNPEEPVFDEAPGKMLYCVTNVTDKKSVVDTFEKAKETFGSVDVLVNNAGINIPRLLVDTKNPEGEFELDEAVWNKVMNVNLNGVFLCAQAAARQMAEQDRGVIINMSSESGLEGSEGQSVYAATKAAVNSLTRSWCKELGKHGIRVVGVAPGIMEATGLRTLAYESALAYTRGITVDELRAGYSKTSTTPMGRAGKLDEVANLCLFLASDRGGYIDGVTYNVAGGKTRG